MNFDEYPSFLSKSEEIFGGGISAIVLNAGVSLHEGNFLNVTLNGFTEQMDTNLKSGFFFAQEYIKKQLEQKREGIKQEKNIEIKPKRGRPRKEDVEVEDIYDGFRRSENIRKDQVNDMSRGIEQINKDLVENKSQKGVLNE